MMEINKNLLEDLYWNKKLSTSKMARMYNVEKTTILRWMIKYNIRRRTISEAIKLNPINPLFTFKGRKSPKKGKTHIEIYGKEKAEEMRIKNRNWHIGKSPANKGIPLSEKRKEEIKKALKGKKQSEETKKKRSITMKEGYKNGRIKSARGMLGKKWSKKQRKMMILAYKNKSYNKRYGKEKAEEIKEKLREARKLQRFPKFKTKPELNFIKLIKKHNLPYKFTGDGRFWIQNINPDFVNCNGEKVCVEIWGNYWHNREDMKKKDEEKLITLKKYGWKRIEIWEHEINNPKNEDMIIRKIGGF